MQRKTRKLKGGGRGTMDFWLNGFDVAYMKIGPGVNATPVKYDPEFDPYTEISRFGASGMPVNFFGHDSGDGKLHVGKVNVISGDQCFTQLGNFAQHEGSRLDESEAWKLSKLRGALGKDPKSLFCVFNKKNDPIIAEKGDSGSPLIIDHQGTPILAGIMSAKIDVEKVSDYNSIFYYSNIANNSAFLKTCANEGLSSRSKRATSTPDVCESGGPYIAYTEPVLVPVNSLLLD